MSLEPQALMEVYNLLRKLDVVLLGVETDASEALGPVRLERAIRDTKAGLKESRATLNKILAEFEEIQHGNAQSRINGNGSGGVAELPGGSGVVLAGS